MGKYLRKFETTAAYDAAKDGLIKPNVSLCEDSNVVYYAPVPPPFFCKLTLNNGEVVDLEGSGELTSAMTSSYKSTLVSAEIGTLCTSIGSMAFISFTSLTSINILDSVTSIGSFAFAGCSSLTSIAIPYSVTNIGESVFRDCKGLTSIVIPNGVTSIGSYAFSGCYGLTSVIIPDSVTSIGNSAFYRCSGLTNCTIGNSVTSIDNYAFQDCSGLTSITSLAMTAPTITNTTFNSVKTDGTLTVPSGSSGYDVWMGTGDYYLGKYNWTKVEQ